MYKDISIAFVSILIFTSINILSGIINDMLGFYYGLNQVIDSIPLFIIYGFLYWLTSLINIRLRKSLRLPIIRTLLWILISIPLLTNGSNALATGDLIDAVLPFFFLLTNPLVHLLNSITWLREIRFGLWGVMILSVSVYQFFILEVSTFIVNRR